MGSGQASGLALAAAAGAGGGADAQPPSSIAAAHPASARPRRHAANRWVGRRGASAGAGGRSVVAVVVFIAVAFRRSVTCGPPGDAAGAVAMTSASRVSGLGTLLSARSALPSPLPLKSPKRTS
jgi:hypothetical protein